MNDHILLNIPRGPPGPPSDVGSVATTALATEVGSFVGEPRDAFLRSLTFAKPNNNNINIEDENEENNDDEGEMSWGLTFSDPPVLSSSSRNKWRSRSSGGGSKKLKVESVEGVATLSKIRPGDSLKSINGKRMGPSYNAARAMEYMHQRLEEDGYLHVAVGNEEGDDVLIQATILKPSPDMTYDKSGMVVWYWGCLCIKSLDKESLFYHSVLKEDDHIVSINDIICDRLKPEQFALIFDELPVEITIVVRRGKQRWTGRFG